MSTSSRNSKGNNMSENGSTMNQPPDPGRRSKDIIRALMNPSRLDTVPWSSSDLRAMLEHQLATPLTSELDRLAELSQCSREQAISIITSCGCHSFGDLLREDSPFVSALKMLKDYAKASLVNEEDLPRDVARVLYVIAILRGREAGIADVSSLDDMSIERAVRRCLTYGWLPDDVRELLRNRL